ncbi:MAG: hypothetical protein ABSA27_05370 [Terriglobales bacterium]|jgi:glycine cleavage system aminomethyltransferase T
MANDWTFWLQVMNLALVAVTVLAALVVTGAVGWELWNRKEHRAHVADSLDAEMWAMSRADLHTLSVPGLGLTMADGGERVEPSEAESSPEKSEDKPETKSRK